MPSVLAPPAERLDTLPVGVPELTIGYDVADWIQENLRQPNGPKAGKPFSLTTRQIRFLLWWYAVDEDGRWLFSHGVRRLAKGSGKSPFAAVLALAEFCGPVRLKDRDDRVLGKCAGKPVEMPLVQISATAESQTANTMRMIRALAPKGSKVVSKYGLDPGKTRYYKLPEGTLEVITSSATAAEGGEASFIVGDETEHWKPQNGGVELASTLADNLAKSGSRMLETANAWVPGIESVAENTWDGWLLQEEGRTRGKTQILYDAVVAPDDTDMDDPDSLAKGLEFVYADCEWVDVPTLIERIYTPTSKREDSKRKYLNWPTAAADAWVEKESWTKLSDPTIQVEQGAEIVLFFDGSKSRDATALIGCEVESGHVFTLGVWEPDPNDDLDQVDAAAVDREVALAFEHYDVAAFFADVREWESFANVQWPQQYGDELRLWAIPNGKPPAPIAWDMRSKPMDFAKAVEVCEAEILSGEFTHDGDSRVTRHVINARRRPYRTWISIAKESPASPRKIDAAVCVVGARMVRRLYLSSGKRKKKRRERSGKAVFV
jgi:hypothetical protein